MKNDYLLIINVIWWIIINSGFIVDRFVYSEFKLICFYYLCLEIKSNITIGILSADYLLEEVNF